MCVCLGGGGAGSGPRSQQVHTRARCPSQNVIDATRHVFQTITISWMKSQITAPPISTTTGAYHTRLKLVRHTKTLQIVKSKYQLQPAYILQNIPVQLIAEVLNAVSVLRNPPSKKTSSTRICNLHQGVGTSMTGCHLL